MIQADSSSMVTATSQFVLPHLPSLQSRHQMHTVLAGPLAHWTGERLLKPRRPDPGDFVFHRSKTAVTCGELFGKISVLLAAPTDDAAVLRRASQATGRAGVTFRILIHEAEHLAEDAVQASVSCYEWVFFPDRGARLARRVSRYANVGFLNPDLVTVVAGTSQ